MPSLNDSAAWRALQQHASQVRNRRLSELFTDDPERAERFAVEAVGLYLDFSKQLITVETLKKLVALAEQQDLPEWIEKLFAGELVNHTEGRAAYHMALRAPRDAVMSVGGINVVPQVHEVLDRMSAFAEQLRTGAWLGAKGQTITDVVNIGIGGSDLGPRMVCEALADYADGPRTHFVANVDAAQLTSVLAPLDPARTLFIVTSKTFTTQETMANARAARDWFVDHMGEAAVKQHFVAVSTNAAEVARFGIGAEQMFGFWDWVGGRYSAWSAVGLAVMIAIGPQRYREWLAGAHAMDEHFHTAPFERNLPVLLALVACWNYNFLDMPTQVVAPYAQRLEHFVAWLQQLEMESNGKGVHRDGSIASVATTPAIWGDVGTNSQHAFFQMLHQGTAVHPVDFILPLTASHDLEGQHRMLIANCLAQSAALMRGKPATEVRNELASKLKLTDGALAEALPHRVFTGNRPSNTLLMPRLDPHHLGALMAMYEHRTFVLSVLWDINAFDQWGVELGKKLAQDVLKAFDGSDVNLDPSTRRLLSRVTGG